MAGPPTSAFAQYTYVLTNSQASRAANVTGGIEFNGNWDDALDVLQANWESYLRATMVNTTTCTEVRLKRGPVASGETRIRTIGTLGTQNSPAAPSNTAFLVRYPAAGVSGRFAGRQFWPWVNEGQINNGGDLTDAGYRASVQSAFVDAWDDLGQAGFTPVILSSTSDPRLAGTPTLAARVATQRRRLRG